MEREVRVRCRQEDADLVKEVLDDAVKEFIELIKKETDFDFTCKGFLDEYNILKGPQAE